MYYRSAPAGAGTVYYEVDAVSNAHCFSSQGNCESAAENNCGLGTSCVNAGLSTCLWTDVSFDWYCAIAGTPTGGSTNIPAGSSPPPALSTSCLVTRNKNDCTSCTEARSYASTIDCPSHGAGWTVTSYTCNVLNGLFSAQWVCTGPSSSVAPTLQKTLSLAAAAAVALAL